MHNWGYRRMKTNEELTVGYDNDESYEEEWEYVIRKLTPCECWNLQGFSTEDFLTAKTGSRETSKELLKLDPKNHLEMMEKAENINHISNSQLYKQAGNSITVDTLYHIMLNLYKAMPYLFDDLKCISFFSGIGAFEMALNRLYDTINNPDSAGGVFNYWLTWSKTGASRKLD